MLYRNTFPEFLESISLGPDKSFLEKNTSYCEFVSSFPQEVDLMYSWKNVKKSSNPINALRNFSKQLIVNGPDLDVQTLNFFVKKVKNFPADYSETVINEVGLAFENAKKRTSDKNVDTTNPSNYITNNTEVHKDNSFLDLLSKLLQSCNKPCNYFKKASSTFGTLSDFGRALSDSASILGASIDDIMHAPTNISTDMVNKIKPGFRTEFYKLKLMTQSVYRDGVKPFFSDSDRARIKAEAAKGITPDNKAETIINDKRMPLVGDTLTYFNAAGSHSKAQQLVKSKLGDCYRTHDDQMRYNPYDPLMNTAYSKRKFIAIKNGDIKSLVDITGSLAPSQYTTDTTYKENLSISEDDLKIIMKFEDTDKAVLAKTYDAASAGEVQTYTAGNGAAINFDDTPTTGKKYIFQKHQIKLTHYGYPKDSSPDPGSKMGFGNSDNLLQPLISIAVAPETLGTYVKKGDVLFITCTDTSGNTFTERRQVADQSEKGKLQSGGNYSFLIDEYVPDLKKYQSKLANREQDFKQVIIEVADTREPLEKYTEIKASKHASMFYSKDDWNYVLNHGGNFSGKQLEVYNKMKSGVLNDFRHWT